MKASKEIVTPSLYVFVAELQDMLNDGWTVDLENTPPYMNGINYVVGLTKDVDENEPVKLSRAEILANARAARAAKAKAASNESEE